MPVRVQLPDLEHWKAQVKCQAGCPVRTDAGRYVQLIAEGRDEDAFLVARAPNPFASVWGFGTPTGKMSVRFCSPWPATE